MAIDPPKSEEIVAMLRRVEVLMGQGMPRIDASALISVSEQTEEGKVVAEPSGAVDLHGKIVGTKLDKVRDRLRVALSERNFIDATRVSGSPRITVSIKTAPKLLPPQQPLN